MKLKKGFRQLVDEAKARITSISVDEAKRRHGRDDVVFVDLRDVRELEREGLIPGAFHCPRGMLEFWIDPESPYHKDVFAPGKQFVFYCNGAWRSALAADVAQQVGLPNVVELDGGFTAWKNAGLAAEGIAHILSSDFARARTTAEHLQRATGAPLTFEPLLQERNFGDLRGTPYVDLGFDPFEPDYAPPKGETWPVFHA